MFWPLTIKNVVEKLSFLMITCMINGDERIKEDWLVNIVYWQY